MKNSPKKIIISVVILIVLISLVPAGYLVSAVWIKTFGIRVLPEAVHKPQNVEFFLQNDPQWKDELLGDSGQNLAQVGCLVSVLASDIDYLGYKTNPPDLNSLFNSNGVYTSSGEVIWNKISEAIPDVKYDYTRVFTSRTLENHLKNGRLPIVKVKYKKTGIFHWVLIIGSDNEDFLIMDPLNPTQEPIRLRTHGRVYAYRVLNNSLVDVMNKVHDQETMDYQEVIGLKETDVTEMYLGYRSPVDGWEFNTVDRGLISQGIRFLSEQKFIKRAEPQSPVVATGSPPWYLLGFYNKNKEFIGISFRKHDLTAFTVRNETTNAVKYYRIVNRPANFADSFFANLKQFHGTSLNADYPADFDFELKYGVNARNVINTFDDTFTKDLVSAGTAKTKMALTLEEKREVYSEMNRMGFFKLPAVFTPKGKGGVEPHNSYYFKVRYNGQIKEVSWVDENLSEDYKALEMRNLINKITNNVQKRPEFKDLPEPKGGYL